jgi:hypothetical protein
MYTAAKLSHNGIKTGKEHRLKWTCSQSAQLYALTQRQPPHLLLQRINISLYATSAVAGNISETSVNFYQTTRSNIPQNSYLQRKAFPCYYPVLWRQADSTEDAKVSVKHAASIFRAEVATLGNGGIIHSWRNRSLREWTNHRRALSGRREMITFLFSLSSSSLLTWHLLVKPLTKCSLYPTENIIRRVGLENWNL